MRVIVVGGGLSGLFTATELVAAGIDDVTVVEESPQPGGVVSTVESDGYMLETAVGSMGIPHPHLSPILDRIGAEVTPIRSGSETRYVFARGRLIAVAVSPKLLLNPLVSPMGKLRLLGEPWKDRADAEESLHDFCVRRFGGPAGRVMAWLMATGVYAGDPGLLSAEAAFPMLTALEQNHGSVLAGVWSMRRSRPGGMTRPRAHVPSGGMTRLVHAATRYLGQRYRDHFTVDTLRGVGDGWMVEGNEGLAADAVVVAVRPEHAASLVDHDLSGHLRKAKSAPVVVVGLGGRGESPAPAGFGALVGPDAGMVTRGVLFESSYAPERAPDGHWLVKVIAGGAIDPGFVDEDDAAIVDRVVTETTRVLGSLPDPSFTAVVRHIPGIPQYHLGHRAWLGQLDQMLEARPGLHFSGWGYRGVGITGIASEAAALSRQIAARLGS